MRGGEGLVRRRSSVVVVVVVRRDGSDGSSVHVVGGDGGEDELGRGGRVGEGVRERGRAVGGRVA